TGEFEPLNLTHPGPFALNITTSATTPAGTYPLTVTCTNGALSAATNLILTVTTNADFRISVEPNQLTLSQGQNGFANFEVRSENGYSQSVSLSATGLPAGV